MFKVSHPFWNSTGKLENEVRSLKFVKACTNVPVPNVLAWYAEPVQPYEIYKNRKEFIQQQRQINPNPAREYLVMQFVQGENLGEIWSSLSWEQRKVLSFNLLQVLPGAF
jgi:hypothetical protein